MRHAWCVLCVVAAVAGCGSSAEQAEPVVEAVAPTTVGATLPVYDDDRTDLSPGPAPDGFDQGVLEATMRSAVRFSGEGCRRTQIGSGFVVGQDLVATNAHVVAGVDDLVLAFHPAEFVDDIDELAPVTGTVVGFDPSADVALIEVPTGDRPVLALVDGELDDDGFVLGFGGAGASGVLDPDPFRINRLITATGENIYRDPGENRRAAYLIAATIEPGDSGGALVRPDATVAGMAFASSKNGGGAYALRASVLADHIASPTISGDPSRCASG